MKFEFNITWGRKEESNEPPSLRETWERNGYCSRRVFPGPEERSEVIGSPVWSLPAPPSLTFQCLSGLNTRPASVSSCGRKGQPSCRGLSWTRPTSVAGPWTNITSSMLKVVRELMSPLRDSLVSPLEPFSGQRNLDISSVASPLLTAIFHQTPQYS